MGQDNKHHSAKSLLLPHDEDEQDAPPRAERPRRPRLARHRESRYAFGIHLVMLIIYISLLVLFLGSRPACKSGQRYNPAEAYIEPEVRLIPDGPAAVADSPFVGSKPRAQIDAAWDNLLRFLNLRFTKAEMDKMEKSSIEFEKGGGYMGMFGVFHELHCLKMIRQAIHRDEYYANMSHDTIVAHTDHCIDALRTSTMCRADTTVFTYFWSDTNRYPNPKWGQQHECVSWDKLQEFLEERRVDIFDTNVMVHPKYGPSFPGGQRHVEEPHGPEILPLDQE